jgi:hypothetical protein
MFIPDPDLDFLSIPDPGLKKSSDPGSGSATLLSWIGRFRAGNFAAKSFPEQVAFIFNDVQTGQF